MFKFFYQECVGRAFQIIKILSSLYHGEKLLSEQGIKSFQLFINYFSNPSNDKEFKENSFKKELIQSLDFQNLQFLSENLNQVHPKLLKLSEILHNYFCEEENLENLSKVMIFTQNRSTASEIQQFLAKNIKIRPALFVGQANSGNKEGLTQKEQLITLKKFKENEYNTLVATCIGEEGLDIGEIDLIVCYDSGFSPIRSLQRRGRTGRQRSGKVMILLMEGKEYNSYLASQKKNEKLNRELAYNANFQQCQKIVSKFRRLQFYSFNPSMVPEGKCPSLKFQDPENLFNNINNKSDCKDSSKEKKKKAKKKQKISKRRQKKNKEENDQENNQIILEEPLDDNFSNQQQRNLITNDTLDKTKVDILKENIQNEENEINIQQQTVNIQISNEKSNNQDQNIPIQNQINIQNQLLLQEQQHEFKNIEDIQDLNSVQKLDNISKNYRKSIDMIQLKLQEQISQDHIQDHIDQMRVSTSSNLIQKEIIQNNTFKQDQQESEQFNIELKHKDYFNIKEIEESIFKINKNRELNMGQTTTILSVNSKQKQDQIRFNMNNSKGSCYQPHTPIRQIQSTSTESSVSNCKKTLLFQKESPCLSNNQMIIKFKQEISPFNSQQQSQCSIKNKQTKKLSEIYNEANQFQDNLKTQLNPFQNLQKNQENYDQINTKSIQNNEKDFRIYQKDINKFQSNCYKFSNNLPQKNLHTSYILKSQQTINEFKLEQILSSQDQHKSIKRKQTLSSYKNNVLESEDITLDEINIMEILNQHEQNKKIKKESNDFSDFDFDDIDIVLKEHELNNQKPNKTILKS